MLRTGGQRMCISTEYSLNERTFRWEWITTTIYPLIIFLLFFDKCHELMQRNMLRKLTHICLALSQSVPKPSTILLPALAPIMYEVLIEICKLHLGIHHVDLIVMQTPAKPTHHTTSTMHIRHYHYGKILSSIVIRCWIELTQDYRTITRQNHRVRVRDRRRT